MLGGWFYCGIQTGSLLGNFITLIMPFHFILFIHFCIIFQLLRMRATAVSLLGNSGTTAELSWKISAWLLKYSWSSCLLSHELARGHISQQDACHMKGQSGCHFSHAHEYLSTCAVLCQFQRMEILIYVFVLLCFFCCSFGTSFLFLRYLLEFSTSPATYIWNLGPYKKRAFSS